jgi:flagellar motor switch protein FliG
MKGEMMVAGQEALRKVALLVASLDRDTADQLLAQLPADRALVVRNAVLALTEVDTGEQTAVIRDFLGVESQRSVTPQAWINRPRRAPLPDRASWQRAPTSPSSLAAKADGHADPTSKPLERASERLIAECLCAELPQAIAVALAQLPAQRASEVVAHLPAPLQAEVLERLVEFDATNSLDSPEIRDEFYQWLNEQLERSLHRAELAARLATILDATHAGTRQLILNNVSHSDARLAKELQHQLAALAASPDS